ncbi:MAG: hypothetical protein ABJQ14_15705, partial [Hyphomicrobiales bacterium]
KDTCKIVPSKVRYAAKLVEWPAMDMANYRQDLRAAGEMLESCYGLNFAPLLERALGEIPFQVACPNYHRHYKWQLGEAMAMARFDRGDFRALAEPVEFATADMRLAAGTALLVGSSGSTGSPKLVPLSHSNILSATHAIA